MTTAKGNNILSYLIYINRYAFVEFESEESAQRAMDNLNNTKLLGREIYISV